MSTAETSRLTPEERRVLVERIRQNFSDKRARGELLAPSATEVLDELEQDQREGRVVKHDWRCSPAEKARLYEAARASGIIASAFLREAVSRACDEVLV